MPFGSTASLTRSWKRLRAWLLYKYMFITASWYTGAVRVLTPSMLGADVDELLEPFAVLLVRGHVSRDGEAEQEDERPHPVGRRQAEPEERQVQLSRRLGEDPVRLEDRLAVAGNDRGKPGMSARRRGVDLGAGARWRRSRGSGCRTPVCARVSRLLGGEGKFVGFAILEPGARNRRGELLLRRTPTRPRSPSAARRT